MRKPAPEISAAPSGNPDQTRFSIGKEPPPVAIPLSRLPVGASCVISSIGGEGALRRRLLDMGLTPKTPVTINKAAPLGDPLELSLRGYTLSLRKDDASLISVVKTGKGEAERS